MIKIDKDIPPPLTDRRIWSPLIKSMEVGDSFFVPREEITADAMRGRMSYQAARHRVKLRTVEVDGGTRVWRIA